MTLTSRHKSEGTEDTCTQCGKSRYSEIHYLLGPGNLSHCCNCGSVQKKFDSIQHQRYCEQIKLEQEWNKCLICEDQISENPIVTLTPRQLEVLQLLSLGYNNSHIKSKLIVGQKSVENYINALYLALHVVPGNIYHQRVVAVLLYLEYKTGMIFITEELRSRLNNAIPTS